MAVKKTNKKALVEELLDIRLIPISCKYKKCPAYNRCTMLPTEVVGKGDVQVLFVGQGGGKIEGSLRRPFVGRAGMTQRKIIRQAKQDLNIAEGKNCFAMSNTCRFAPGWEERKNRTPTQEELDYCLPYLKRDILELNPKTIVLLGDAVFNAFYPTLNAKEHRSKPLELKLEGKTFNVVFTYHPSYGLRNPDVLGKILHDVKIAFGYKHPNIYEKGSKKKDVDYKILSTIPEIRKLVKRFMSSTNPVALDIEALNLNRLSGNNVISIQLSNDGDIGYVIPLHHPESPFSVGDTPKIVKLMNLLLSNKAKYPFVIGQNIKYDYTVLLSFLGIRIQKTVADTMCAAFLLNENLVKDEDSEEDQDQSQTALGGLGLANLLRSYGYDEDWYFNAKKSAATLYDQPLVDVAKYGGADAALTWRLLRCQFEEAKNQDYFPQFITMLLKFYSEQIKFFSALELNGMPISKSYLALLMSETKSPIIKHIKDTIKELYAKPSVVKANSVLTRNQKSIFGNVWLFDINKPAHQVLLFFNILKLKPESVGKSGKPSVGKKFKEMYADVPEVFLYNKYIRGTKLFGTYVKQIWEIVTQNEDAKDSRLRAQFKGTRARTGRSSVSDPNLQQLVRKKEGDELPKIVRKLFVSDIGKVFVKLDLMAAEVRGWGEQSKDKVMTEIIIHGAELRKKYFLDGPNEELLNRVKTEGDIHRSFASLFYDLSILKITKDMRSDSKNITFGVTYGLGLPNLSKSIKKTIEETKMVLNKFFSKFPQGSKWLKNICKWAARTLQVDSPLGRKRRLWHYLIDFPLSEKSTRTNIVINTYDGLTNATHGKGDRRAKNTPIQATASDINFIGAFLVQRYIEKHKKPWKAVNVVHDSLELEVPAQDIKESILVCKVIYESIIKKYLELHFNYKTKIPIEVEFEVGLDMASTVEWDGAYATLSGLQNDMIKLDKERTKV